MRQYSSVICFFLSSFSPTVVHRVFSEAFFQMIVYCIGFNRVLFSKSALQCSIQSPYSTMTPWCQSPWERVHLTLHGPYPRTSVVPIHPSGGVKIAIFAASIALGFSVNGSTQDRLENLTGQTILVQKPRTLQNLGLGIQELSDKANFSQEMLFLQG